MEKSHLTSRMALTISLLALAGTAALGWRVLLRGPAAAEGSDGGEWLPAAPEERIAETEKHLRGFDVAMMEVGYRFTELYFAGRERN